MSMACIIEGVLIKRDKPNSIVQSISTGSWYSVSTKDMQVRMSWANNKPVKDAKGRYYVRFDTANSKWVNYKKDFDPTR